MKNTEENSKIGKVQKKIVNRHGKYGRKASNSEMICEIWKKSKMKCEMKWKEK